MRWKTSAPATGLEVLGRTIEVFGNNVAANDIAKMRLLVNGWEERAHTAHLRDLGQRVLDKAEKLPPNLLQEAQKEVDQLRAESVEEDSVLGASKNDPRSRVQVFVIQPSENLPGSSLRNTLQDQRRMYLYGQKDAKDFLTWLQGECTRLNADTTGAGRPARFRVFTQTAR
jgi:hypothetical protein